MRASNICSLLSSPCILWASPIHNVPSYFRSLLPPLCSNSQAPTPPKPNSGSKPQVFFKAKGQSCCSIYIYLYYLTVYKTLLPFLFGSHLPFMGHWWIFCIISLVLFSKSLCFFLHDFASTMISGNACVMLYNWPYKALPGTMEKAGITDAISPCRTPSLELLRKFMLFSISNPKENQLRNQGNGSKYLILLWELKLIN